MDSLRLDARPDADARCPYCRDALAEPTRTCPHCATVLHAACRADLGRCPTPGCAASVAPATPAPAAPARRAPPPPAPVPALDRGLDELARRIGSRAPVRRPQVERRTGLAEARRILFALVLSLPVVMVLVKLALVASAYFVEQGLSSRSAGKLGTWIAISALIALVLFVRWLWPQALEPDRREDPPY